MPDEDELEDHISKQSSMLSGIVQIGRIIEETSGDPEEPMDMIPRVLVQVGGEDEGSYSRNWMPWVATRAGYDAEWWRPELDEQVLVLAPSGNLAQGIIAGTLYRGTLSFDQKEGGEFGEIEHRDPIPPEDEQHRHQRIYQDGTRIIYDHGSHQFALSLKQTPEDEAPLVSLTAELMDDKGKLTLLLGTEDEPKLKIIADADQEGDLQIIAAQKTTLIAGSVDDPKVKILADASADGELTIEAQGAVAVSAVGNVDVTTDGNITLTAGATVITVNQDGAVDIDASNNDTTIASNIEVTGTLDVS